MREFNAKLGRLAFSFEWRLSLFTLVLLPLLMTLGFWQLDRADEKRLLAQRHQERMALAPLTLQDALLTLRTDPSALADRRITFMAQAEPNRYWLLDNRLRGGRFGYEVIALLHSEGVYVPVNLGWLPGDPARQSLPDVQLPTERQLWSGRVYLPAGDAYVLGDNADPDGFPAVIQAYKPVEYARVLERLLASPAMPFSVRIDPGHSAAWVADWPVVNQSPEKHTGYAVQWFTMAAVLALAFLLRSSNLGALFRARSTSQTP